MKHLSLFTGSGIGDLAAQAAGILTVAQCESDPVCQYALRRLWPDAHLFEDVRDVTVETLGRFGLLPIDIISGGPPCQPTSIAGKGRGEKDPRWLWPETLRIVAEVRSPWLVFENPLGFCKRALDGILGSLEAMGYTIWPLVVSACATGLRHNRQRFWIVAHARGNGMEFGQDNGSLQCPKTSCGMEPTTESLALPSWARGLGSLAEVPGHNDGLSGGLLPKTRNGLLQLLGNAWVYPLAELIFRWIATQTTE